MELTATLIIGAQRIPLTFWDDPARRPFRVDAAAPELWCADEEVNFYDQARLDLPAGAALEQLFMNDLPVALGGDGSFSFQNCLDYALLSLRLTPGGETESKMFYADRAIRLAMDEALRRRIDLMLAEIAAHTELAAPLFNGRPQSRLNKALSRRQDKNRETLLSLILDTLRVYRDCLGYFSTGSRFDMEKTMVTDRVERLQRLSGATVRSILRRPAELTPVREGAGLRAGSKRFLPRRAVGERNLPTRDTYENRVVLGFLLTLQKILSDLDSPLVRSTLHVKLFLRTEEDEQKLAHCKRETDALLRLYRRVLPIPAEPLAAAPRSTPTFRTIPQYRRIYQQLQLLFDRGLYDLDDQGYLLPMSQLYTLYEAYVLVRLLDKLAERHGSPTPSLYRYKFPVRPCLEALPLPEQKKHLEQELPGIDLEILDDTLFFSGVFSANTFSFPSHDGKTVTLYYQPVIYADDVPARIRTDNDTGLYRCKSADTDSDFLLPDLLIKLEEERGARYVFCDAKFKKRGGVRLQDMPALIGKYVQHIMPLNSKRDRIVGLFAFYGNTVDPRDGSDVFVASVPLMAGMDRDPLDPLAHLLY